MGHSGAKQGPAGGPLMCLQGGHSCACRGHSWAGARDAHAELGQRHAPHPHMHMSAHTHMYAQTHTSVHTHIHASTHT